MNQKITTTYGITTPLSLTAWVAIMMVLPGGCTTRVFPPAQCDEPTAVFIIDYGRHSSLVLPRADGQHVEFTYGEWEYFAKMRDAWYDAFRAVLIPTQSTLGRRDFGQTLTANDLRSRLPAEFVYEITVDKPQVRSLIDHLDRRFARHLDTRIYNPTYQFDFVHDDQVKQFFEPSNLKVLESENFHNNFHNKYLHSK